MTRLDLGDRTPLVAMQRLLLTVYASMIHLDTGDGTPLVAMQRLLLTVYVDHDTLGYG